MDTADLAQAPLTLNHQRQTIEDYVSDSVLRWDQERPITLYFTSGYGPLLRWTVYEFQPRDEDPIFQCQYFRDSVTGTLTRHHRYSPPLGLLRLDQSDEQYISGYLDLLLRPQYLCDLGWQCFLEETELDPGAFQANLLTFMCELYENTDDEDVRGLKASTLVVHILLT